MAKVKKGQGGTLEERLEAALVPETERPYVVPENWVWTRLGYIISLISGRDVSLSLCNDTMSGIPYILGASNLIDNTFRAERWIEKPEVVSVREDVLLSVKGTIGKVYLQQEPQINISRQIMALRVSEALNSKCLVIFLHMVSDMLKEKGNGLIPGISRDTILKTEFPLPPLVEQRRIVERIESLFGKLDRARELVQTTLDSFETRKAAILHKAFTGELTAAWRVSKDYLDNTTIADIAAYAKMLSTKERNYIDVSQKSVGTIFVDSKNFWYSCSIGAVAVVSNGSTPSRKYDEYWNGDIHWVSSGEVRNNIIQSTREKITDAGFKNASVRLLPQGTVLIAMIGEGKTRGQSAVLEIQATTNQNVAAIIIDHGFVLPHFLWYWLQKEYTNNREKGSGTGPQALNCQRVRELEFVLPSLLEQREIVRILDTLLPREQSAKETLAALLDQIDLMKKAILARAFRGELGTNDSTDESAVTLLKGILKQ